MIWRGGSLWITFLVTVFVSTQLPGYGVDSTHRRHRQFGADSKVGDLENSLNDTIDVITTRSPRIPDLIVKPHEEVRLNCYLPRIPPDGNTFGITWLHNGVQVDTVDVGSTSGHRFFRDPLSGQLHISHIRLEDDGLWQCQYHESSMRPLMSKPLKLIVLDQPRSPYLLIDGRRLDPGNAFIPVKETSEITVTCVVEGGNPSPNIKWVLILSSDLDPALMTSELYLDQVLNITDSSSDENRVHAHAYTRSEAKLASVRRIHHNATFMCIVQHVTLMSPNNASVLLDVQYSPSFAISREPGFGFPLREGIPVSLKCDVDSNPPSTPIWQKDDGTPPVVQSRDGFLNFTAIRREHSGWYKCMTHHLLGEFSSIGYFLNVRNDINITQDPLPESYPSGRQVEVPLGGAVHLQCPEEAMGCWSRVGINGRLEPVGPGPGLTLSSILYQEAGEYRCVSNKRGEFDRWRSEVNVDVTVKGRPVVYPPETSITSYTGQRLEFSVEFCSNPPATKVFWVSETAKLTPGQVSDEFIAHNITDGSSIHCHQSTLVMKEVKPSLEGEYIFIVKSASGLAEGTVYVNVSSVSGYGSNMAATNKATLYCIAMLANLFLMVTKL